MLLDMRFLRTSLGDSVERLLASHAPQAAVLVTVLHAILVEEEAAKWARGGPKPPRKRTTTTREEAHTHPVPPVPTVRKHVR